MHIYSQTKGLEVTDLTAAGDLGSQPRERERVTGGGNSSNNCSWGKG